MSVERFQLLVNNAFQEIESRLNGAASGPLHAVRRKALESFQQQGVPTTRHEEWKYTNILPSLAADYRIGRISASMAESNTGSVLSDGVFDTNLDIDAHRLRIVNGRLHDLATELPDDGSMEVHVINDAHVKAHPEVEKWLLELAPIGTHPFVAANTAMRETSILIRVLRTTSLPLHITIVADASDAETVSTPHILVVVEPNAECTILEEHLHAGDKTSFTTALTQIVAQRDSKCTYVKLVDDVDSATANGETPTVGEATHVGHTAAIVHAHASLRCVTLCLGGKVTRNELEIKLVESSAEAYLYGLSVLDGNELADNHTLVDHVAPHCHSEEEYKGIYDGRSTGVFNGKIMVRPDAQKTTAYQSNRTVLLSPSAQINAKPQLEIFADDVKCSHGATCGQIDDEAVFYLQSRGIGFEDARALIVYAFAAEIVENIPNVALRLIIDRRIADKLGAHPFEL